MWRGTRGTSIDHAFRVPDMKLRNWGGDDQIAWYRWSIFGLWKLFHELACLGIEFGFFVLEIAETAKEFRDTTDKTRGCLAQRVGLGGDSWKPRSGHTQLLVPAMTERS